MQANTGAIKEFTSEEEIAARQKIDGPWVPIPKGDLDRVVKMTIPERKTWAQQQLGKKEKKAKRKAAKEARRRNR